MAEPGHLKVRPSCLLLNVSLGGSTRASVAPGVWVRHPNTSVCATVLAQFLTQPRLVRVGWPVALGTRRVHSRDTLRLDLTWTRRVLRLATTHTFPSFVCLLRVLHRGSLSCSLACRPGPCNSYAVTFVRLLRLYSGNRRVRSGTCCVLDWTWTRSVLRPPNPQRLVALLCRCVELYPATRTNCCW